MISEGKNSGFEVIVHRTGGEAFNEYDVKHTEAGEDTPSITSCWLESEQDATFTVKTTIAPEIVRRHAKYDWAVKVLVDGRVIDGTILTKLRQDHQTSVSCMTFEQAGVLYDGLLKFAALVSLHQTNKDDEVTLTGAALQSLGKIQVEFYRGTEGSVRTSYSRVIAPDVGVAAEKSKKLGGGIGYAQKSAHQPSKASDSSWHDPQSLPLHRIYRPKTVLQLRGIIEHDPPRPRTITPPAPVAQTAGPSRKRKAEVIDIDADEGDPEVKPDTKERIATRVSFLERQLQKANNLLK